MSKPGEINAANAADYLRAAGHVRPRERVEVRELAGGVSNIVLRVSFPEHERDDFVVKQARSQLRTADPWFCTLERIWREVDVLRTCAELLAAARQEASASTSDADEREVSRIETPQVLFEDRDNYLFGMTAAPAEHVVWKHELLAGHCDPAVAQDCGRLLAALHVGSWGKSELERRLDDRQVFDELRLSPYFRATARAHPDAAGWFERLIASVWRRRLSLVHADFSPKNLLVFSGGMLLVDFETGHYGDPAFDLGFFLSHLVLKAFHRAPAHEPYLALTECFWEAYRSGLRGHVAAEEHEPLVWHAIQNLAGCAWARLDGTSKVDYLADPARRALVRDLCRELFRTAPTRWQDVLALAREQLQQT